MVLFIGVRAAEPEGQSVKPGPWSPTLADEVLLELLARFDHFYGDVRGFAGLRVRGNERE
ncbi:hypothetical protein [Streptomyces sp. NPDC048637]|uniref:hypothetical protein n=1 Tax=Streptomyces sp. NPDC048637 TaxID=3155636 RepID=UPI0034403998